MSYCSCGPECTKSDRLIQSDHRRAVNCSMTKTFKLTTLAVVSLAIFGGLFVYLVRGNQTPVARALPAVEQTSAPSTTTAPGTAYGDRDTSELITNETVFVAAMHAQFPDLDNASDREIVGLGTKACGIIKTAGSSQKALRILTSMVDSGDITMEIAEYIAFSMGAATETICPNKQTIS